MLCCALQAPLSYALLLGRATQNYAVLHRATLSYAVLRSAVHCIAVQRCSALKDCFFATPDLLSKTHASRAIAARRYTFLLFL